MTRPTTRLCAALLTLGAWLFPAARPAAAVQAEASPIDDRYGLLGGNKAPDGTIVAPATNKHLSVDQAPGLFAFNADGTLKWSRELYPHYTANSRASFAPDGTIYVALSPRFSNGGGHVPPTGGHYPSGLFAFNARGDDLWHVDLDPFFVFSKRPQVGKDGTVYAAAFNTRNDALHRTSVVAVDPTGFLRWTYTMPRYWVMTPSDLQVGPAGTVYLTIDNPLYDIHRPPQLLIIKDVGGAPDVTWVPFSPKLNPIAPVAETDGSLIVPANARYEGSPGVLFNFEADGRVRWSHELDPIYYVKYQVAVAKDGTFYLPLSIRRPNWGGNPAIVALTPEGTEKWRVELEPYNDLTNPMSIGDDGTLYVAATNLVGGVGQRSSIVAINPNGTVKWRWYLDRYYNPTGPLAGANGAAFVTIDDVNVENPTYPSELLRFEATP